jgi:hypothetical protein
MKKIMIGAAVAAMAISGFAACTDKCVLWDLSLNLKTLDVKKASCKDACGDKSNIYYLDSATRKLTGFLWACAYDCTDADAMNVVLWDSKKKVPVIMCPPVGVYEFATADLTFADLMVYGKKANKIAAAFDLSSDYINVSLAGLNGSIKTGCNDCYIKSLSGNAAGELALIKKAGVSATVVGGLCGDKVETTCEDDDLTAVYTTLCEICCGFDGWCSSGTEDLNTGDFVPAYGTWKMKYNAKKSKDKNMSGIWGYVPSYAL